jgi:hypothetical protein
MKKVLVSAGLVFMLSLMAAGCNSQNSQPQSNNENTGQTQQQTNESTGDKMMDDKSESDSMKKDDSMKSEDSMHNTDDKMMDSGDSMKK